MSGSPTDGPERNAGKEPRPFARVASFWIASSPGPWTRPRRTVIAFVPDNAKVMLGIC